MIRLRERPITIISDIWLGEPWQGPAGKIINESDYDLVLDRTGPERTIDHVLSLDLFGNPIPNIPPDDIGMPGQNQDAGLTLNGDEWAAIEEVWDERTKQSDVEAKDTQEEPHQ